MLRVRAPYTSAVVAVLLHALAIAALPRVLPRPSTADAPAAIEPIELDTTPDESVTSPPPAEPAEGPRLAMRAATSSSSSSPHAAAAGAAASPAAEPSGAPDVEPAPTGSGTFTMPRLLTLAELGIASGGPNPFATSPGLAPGASSEAPRPAGERALRDALRASDRVIGLGPEGPVVTALREATSSSLAPLSGRALFDVRAGEDGSVLGIDLLDASGGPGWDDAKRLALEALRGKKLALPRGSKGANVRVEIVSEMSYPSGQKKKAEFSGRLGENDMPELVLPDESNIGQRPTRKIHARATGTDLF